MGLMQCWSGESHCLVSGVVYAPTSNTGSATYTMIKSIQGESDPALKAIVSLEIALGSDSTPDKSVLSTVLQFVQQSSDTASMPELQSIQSGLERKTIIVSNAGSKDVNGVYRIMNKSVSHDCFKGSHWYKQHAGPHRFFFHTAYSKAPDGWFVDSEKKPQYALYVAEGCQDTVALQGWTVYAGTFSGQGVSPAPTLEPAYEPTHGHEFQRSAWKLCKLARLRIKAATRGHSRSRSRTRDQNHDRNKGKSAGKTFGGSRGGKGSKGSGRLVRRR